MPLNRSLLYFPPGKRIGHFFYLCKVNQSRENNMILIADSGSTSTTWCLITDESSNIDICETAGINPFLQSSAEISETLRNEFTLLKGPFEAIHFYGAGCANPEKNDKVRRSMHEYFDSENIFVDSDLMAAARSLCGTGPGIAAILGTGSNSCFYDGNQIIKHVSPLGYILGDEGSGTVLGKKLLSDILKNQLPEEICRRFYNKYNLEPSEILDRIYRKPFPNRFMAQFTHFIAANTDHPSIHKLVKDSFSEFFIRNIRQLPEAGRLPVNVTGSIGFHFRNILAEAADETGFKTGLISKAPMDGLLEYHRRKTTQS